MTKVYTTNKYKSTPLKLDETLPLTFWMPSGDVLGCNAGTNHGHTNWLGVQTNGMIVSYKASGLTVSVTWIQSQIINLLNNSVACKPCGHTALL